VKANKANIGRTVDQPAAATRFYLFYGPDEAESRALAARLLEALGAAKFLVTASAVKSDPASLADEAGAISLFGDRKLIWIEPAGDDIADGVSALLETPASESPVVAIAGALRKTSVLLKLAEASPRALAFAAYAPEGQDAERMVTDLGRRFGLKISSPVAARLADAAGNDQAIVAQELQKLALYIDASSQAPKELEHRALDEVGADSAEGNFLRLADLALAGEVSELADELARLPAGGNEAIPVVRSLQRRLLMLAPLSARVVRGERADAVMTSASKPLFWKEKAKVQRMLSSWSAEDLATVAERAGKLERELMRPRARPNTAMPVSEALGEELLAIARKARSGR
jgi:DNA polymerase-3 subunit delta